MNRIVCKSVLGPAQKGAIFLLLSGIGLLALPFMLGQRIGVAARALLRWLAGRCPACGGRTTPCDAYSANAGHLEWDKCGQCGWTSDGQ